MSTTSSEPKSAAERARRHRKRRRQGSRCIMIEVSGLEVATLVARGYLPEEEKSDPIAIRGAIEGVISDMSLELELKTT